MKTLQITIKTTEENQRLLRLIAALTGEKQYQVLQRALLRELAQCQKELAQAKKKEAQHA